MKNINIENLIRVSGGILNCADHTLDRMKEASGVCIDSRLVEEGFVFVATKGERTDGHEYIASAFEKGALAVICERVPEGVKGPCIKVKDSLVALKDIAEFYRKQLDIKVVGITGSVGKTSAKEFIAGVLAQKYNVLKTEGNFNNEIGLPLTICKIKPEHEVAVLEMGISDFGEMTRLSKIARPDVAVITNIGQCHLENLGDRDGVLAAKTEIFKYLKEDGVACLCADDDKLSTISDVNGKKPIFFGSNKEVPIHPLSIQTKGLLGSECTIACFDEIFNIKIPLPGIHRIYNALAAIAVGNVLGLTGTQMAAGIAGITATPGRGNVIRTEHLTILDDCYNANPVSMNSAIDLLSLSEDTKVAILGDMFELGSNEIWLHEGVGKYAVKKEIDIICCIGEKGKHIYEGAVEEEKENADSFLTGIEKHLSDNAFMNELKNTMTWNADEVAALEKGERRKIQYYATKEEFYAHIEDVVHPNDAVLVKASHGMHFEEIVERLKEF